MPFHQQIIPAAAAGILFCNAGHDKTPNPIGCLEQVQFLKLAAFLFTLYVEIAFDSCHSFFEITYIIKLCIYEDCNNLDESQERS